MRSLSMFVVLAAWSPAQQFLRDCDPSPPSPLSAQASVPVTGGFGWFFAFDASLDQGLYRTNGTPAGTQRLLEGGIEPVAEFAGALVVRLPSASGMALAATDGTVGGTVPFFPSIGSVKAIGTCNGRLLLRESMPFGVKIWSTDLTTAGTFVLATLTGPWFYAPLGNQGLLFQTATILPTDGQSLGAPITLPIDVERHFHAERAPEVNGAALFLCHRFTASGVVDELWRCDGVSAAPIVAIGPSTYRQIAAVDVAGSGVVFSGDQSTTTTWFSDGTAAGTSVMTTRVRGLTMQTVDSRVFFAGDDGVHGFELWGSDGTDAGTQLLLDATPGPNSSSLVDMRAGATRLFCYDSASYRLLVSDGTVAGTHVLPQSLPPFANSGGFAVLGDTALARTWNSDLLATDGTSAGSVQLTSERTRPGLAGPFAAAPLLADLCFVADTAANGRELWRTDGTATGTALVEDLVPGPADGVGELVGLRGQLWFGSGGDLFRSDGTAAGRTLVHATGASRLENLAVGTSVLSFFTPTLPFLSAPSHVWRSDGVTTVVSPVQALTLHRPLQVGDATCYLSTALHMLVWRGEANGGVDFGVVRPLAALGDRLVFADGNVLKSTDGTLAGTVTIGTTPSPVSLAVANRRDGGTFLVLVVGSGPIHATDGATVFPLPCSAPLRAIGGDDFVLMTVVDPVLGCRLFATDGTAAGTQLVADIGQQWQLDVESLQALGSGNRVLLAVRGDSGGVEPWISDGTPAGTGPLADLNPGGSSDPVGLGAAGGVAFFVADDGVHGPELWRLDLQQVGAANVQSLGTGCPGSNGVPLLRTGASPTLGTSVTTRLSQALPNALAVWLFGAPPLVDVPVGGGCSLHFASLLAIVGVATDAAGAAASTIGIPNAPALLGASLVEQVGVFDPLGVSPFGTATTPGLYWQVGG